MNFIYEKLFDYYCDPILQKRKTSTLPAWSICSPPCR